MHSSLSLYLSTCLSLFICIYASIHTHNFMLLKAYVRLATARAELGSYAEAEEILKVSTHTHIH